MLVLDDEFHRTIFRCCGKELSWLYIQKLDYNYHRLRALALPRIIGDVVSEHQKILDAITAGRVESIDALVEEHMSAKAVDRTVFECPREYFEAHTAPAAPAAQEKGGTAPVHEARLRHTHLSKAHT
jgi:DNA-binding GntR family transcriptional regulator